LIYRCGRRILLKSAARKAGWSLGWVSAIDCEGRTIWIPDAHRDDGKRFVVRADENLTAFRELERAVCIHLLTEKLSELKIANQGLTTEQNRFSKNYS
jgi:hypothetical protein